MAMLQTPTLNRAIETSFHMTEDEFVAWCDEDTKAEWVNGEIIAASPSSLEHVNLAGWLNIVMRLFAEHFERGWVYGPEFQIRFEAQHLRRVPDILFVSKEHADIIRPNHVEGAPDLVIEIVSPDSVVRDWREKYLEYEAAGVREYWVIDPEYRRVEAYTLDADHKYTRIEAQDNALHSLTLTGFYLQPDWLWRAPLPNPLEILKGLGVS